MKVDADPEIYEAVIPVITQSHKYCSYLLM